MTQIQRWNFGRPKRGHAFPSIKTIKVKWNGQDWTASYHVEDGQLSVWGAWGSKSEPVGRTKDLAERATAMFNDILNGHAKRQT